MRPAPLLLLPILLADSSAPAQQAAAEPGEADVTGWTRSYAAGHADANGAYAGGSEIMHLVAHQGRLFAANGYWMDTRWMRPPYPDKQSAQVLRLDSSDGPWQVDLDLGRTNGLGLRYMKANILSSITFTRDATGMPLAKPANLLVAAAGAYMGREGIVSAWVRDDADDTWRHGVVIRGSREGGRRWIPRDMEVHRDSVTGIERLFLLVGDPGIISGVYDPSHPGRIRWERTVEFPANGTFNVRPLGIAVANGALHFSVGGSIHRRTDGPDPAYTEVARLGDRADTDIGGIRGLTAIPHPHGTGDSLLCLWAPDGRSRGQIKRLDPDGHGGYTVHDEVNLRALMKAHLGVEIGYVLGAHSNFHPLTDPATHSTVHLVGFQGNLRTGLQLRWPDAPLYAGALYAIRTADGSYSVREVNGAWAHGKPVLVSPRTFALSPFDDGRVFAGGHDASGVRSDDMAWIFEAPMQVVSGQ